MKALRTVPDAVRAPQLRASDPQHIGVRLGQRRRRQDPRARQPRHSPAARGHAAGKDPLHHLHQGGRGQHGRARVRHARPLDHAGRRAAGSAACAVRRGACGCEAAGAGARTVFVRTGDAGRVEGADHPRALHAAAAAVPVRSQRAGALHGARRPRSVRDHRARDPQRAARCRIEAGERHRQGAHHRDHQFRRPDVSRRRAGCLPRQHRLPGMDRPRRRAGAGANARDAWPRTATSSLPRSNARLSMGRTCRWPGGRRSQPCSTAAARATSSRRKRCARR